MKYIIGTMANLASCVLWRLYRTLPQRLRKKMFKPGTILSRLETVLEDLMIRYDHREDPIW